jgi:molecular chaperone Hsp33
MVRLGSTVDTILSKHCYPENVASQLGEAITLATAMAGSLKFEGSYTLQTCSDGPIGLMIADFFTHGAVRGYARFDGGSLASASGSTVVSRLLGKGLMAFTVDQGPDTESYQGVVQLEGATLAECAQDYLSRSEQLNAAVRINVSCYNQSWRAGGLIVEQLAGNFEDGCNQEEDDWHRVVALMGSIQAHELTQREEAGGSLLYRLFSEDGVRVFDPMPVKAECRCSRERMAKVLASFKLEEMNDMIVGGKISTTCQFCNSTYEFLPNEVVLMAAVANNKRDASGSGA